MQVTIRNPTARAVTANLDTQGKLNLPPGEERTYDIAGDMVSRLEDLGLIVNPGNIGVPNGPAPESKKGLAIAGALATLRAAGCQVEIVPADVSNPHLVLSLPRGTGRDLDERGLPRVTGRGLRDGVRDEAYLDDGRPAAVKRRAKAAAKAERAAAVQVAKDKKNAFK